VDLLDEWRAAGRRRRVDVHEHDRGADAVDERERRRRALPRATLGAAAAALGLTPRGGGARRAGLQNGPSAVRRETPTARRAFGEETKQQQQKPRRRRMALALPPAASPAATTTRSPLQSGQSSTSAVCCERLTFDLESFETSLDDSLRTRAGARASTAAVNLAASPFVIKKTSIPSRAESSTPTAVSAAPRARRSAFASRADMTRYSCSA